MQYKGYEVELIEVRFRDIQQGAKLGSDGFNDLMALAHNRKSTITSLPHWAEPLPVSVEKCFTYHQQRWPKWECLHSLSIYHFSALSALERPILPALLEDSGASDTIGNETIFWERLMECKAKTGDHYNGFWGYGSFITAWAVDTISRGEDEWEDEWELIGYVGPDMQIIEVGFSWPVKTDPYYYYIASEMTTDPSFGLQIYLRGFSFETCFDEAEPERSIVDA